MRLATAAAVILAALPSIYALIAAPKGSSYLGFQYNADDHMVYAAWMRQAMDGRFLFDNRFTTDAQPGLTIHVYFWVLGLVAKVVGIPWAMTLSRLFFTGLFVPLLYNLVRRVTNSVFATRLAISLTVLGGGVGFLVWHNFGQVITRPAPAPVSAAMGGKLPIDVWQPEAFVFPSMLTNGLFMVSLCLILVVFRCFIDARDNWKPALWGVLALGCLMNIHSYDVLIVAFTMLGFLAMQLAVRRISWIWTARGLIIALGAIPPALWFVHVLRSDPVFQARAATLTYSPDFRQVFFGYVLMMALALPGLWLRATAKRQKIGLGILVLLIVGLFAGSVTVGPGYFLDTGPWLGVALLAVAALTLMAQDDEAAYNLLLSWAVMGLVALYFPALFQRKLAMGLSIPWAILATLGFARLLRDGDRNARNLATILVILVCSATSIRWFFREKYFIDARVCNTTVHPVFLTRDVREILSIIGRDQRPRKVVIAMPGRWSPEFDSSGELVPDKFGPPAVPDLNPILSGLTGAYTYAGHWSETPDYDRKRAALTALFDRHLPDDRRDAIVNTVSPDYIVQPSQETFGETLRVLGFDLANLSRYGDVVYPGTQFQLIRVRK